MNLNVLKDSSEFIYYNNPNIPIYVRKGNLTSFQNMKALCHWHEDIEFLMSVKGHISYKVNGQTFFIEEREAIFVNSRQMHYGFSSDFTDCEYICIVFNPKSLFALPSIQNQYVEPLLESDISELIIKADCNTNIQLLNSLQQLYTLYLQDDAIAVELKAMHILYKTWESLYQMAQPFLLQEITSFDSNLQILKKMLSCIYSYYDTKISLADIANAGSIGKSKCCKIFKLYLNRTPNDYLNAYRLEKSMLLLRDLSLSITDISYTCGFSNPSYFAEIFLKYKGCTPTEYRLKI